MTKGYVTEKELENLFEEAEKCALTHGYVGLYYVAYLRAGVASLTGYDNLIKKAIEKYRKKAPT